MKGFVLPLNESVKHLETNVKANKNPAKAESRLSVCYLCTKRSQDYKNNFMLNSAEHEIFLLTNVKVPIIVGILTFMSRKAYKSLENAEFLDIFILMSI